MPGKPPTWRSRCPTTAGSTWCQPSSAWARRTGTCTRATLESIAYQSRDLADAMAHAGQPIHTLKVDGGGTANPFLMQFQADILGVPVEVAAVQETTALGAAYLAGLATDFWHGTDDLAGHWHSVRTYEPRMSADRREAMHAQWLRAVDRSKGWLA